MFGVWCLFETVSGVLDVTVSRGGLHKPLVSSPLTCVVTKLNGCLAGSIFLTCWQSEIYLFNPV